MIFSCSPRRYAPGGDSPRGHCATRSKNMLTRRRPESRGPRQRQTARPDVSSVPRRAVGITRILPAGAQPDARRPAVRAATLVVSASVTTATTPSAPGRRFIDLGHGGLGLPHRALGMNAAARIDGLMTDRTTKPGGDRAYGSVWGSSRVVRWERETPGRPVRAVEDQGMAAPAKPPRSRRNREGAAFSRAVIDRHPPPGSTSDQ